MARILVVEDQEKHLDSLRRGLEAEGYEIVTASTGDEGFRAASTRAVDAVVLDLMLPGRHGLTVLRDLRAGGFAKPVLILTALDAIEERVQGLDTGANDYLVKPFAFAELLARLRRSSAATSPSANCFCAPTTWRWTFSLAVSHGAPLTSNLPAGSMNCSNTSSATRMRR